MKTTWLWILIIVVILGVFGYFLFRSSYGPQEQPTPASQQTEVIEQNTVSISNFSFDPEGISVKAGTEVTFTNNDSVSHTITGDNFDSGEFEPGESYKKVFDNTGTFDYFCKIHPYMKGEVIVK